MAKIIFVSGIHGVGKTTLCEQLKRHFSLGVYSSSQLIKKKSGFIGSDKKVIPDIARRNQLLLLDAIREIPDDTILLDGHFCLIDMDENIMSIDEDIFEQMDFISVINVRCSSELINVRLRHRDGYGYTLELLGRFQYQEAFLAKRYCLKHNVPIFEHDSGDDVSGVIMLIQNLLLDFQK